MTKDPKTFDKSPEEELDYGFIMDDWLPAGGSITSAQWSVSSGTIEVEDKGFSATTATARIKGGSMGEFAQVVCVMTVAPTGEVVARRANFALVPK